MTVDYAFFLHEIANLCELVADHCTNIAEQVIYLNTGTGVDACGTRRRVGLRWGRRRPRPSLFRRNHVTYFAGGTLAHGAKGVDRRVHIILRYEGPETEAERTVATLAWVRAEEGVGAVEGGRR